MKVFNQINIINDSNATLFATKNVAHCFTKSMTFEDWKQGFDYYKLNWMTVNDMKYDRFLYKPFGKVDNESN